MNPLTTTKLVRREATRLAVRRAAAWLGFAIMSFAALGTAHAQAQAPSQEPIRIGLSTALTGAAALAAQWEKWGVEQAAEEINANGGVLGRKLEIITVDNRCNPTEGANSARALIQQKVSAIIGAHCSSATLAMMPIIQEAKVPMITGVSSSPKIADMSGAGGNGYMFRICPDDLMLARMLVGYLGDKKLFKTLAVIGEDTDFGRGGAAAFTPLAQQAGMSIVSTDFTPQMSPDFTPLLTRVARRRPDAIALFMLGSDQINLLRNAQQLGLSIPYTGRVELAGKMLELVSDGALEGALSAWSYSPEIDNPVNKKFAATYQSKHQTAATLQSWAGYDSTRLYAQAIKEAGSADPEKIRDALTKTRFTTLLGRTVSFDDHNQAGRVAVIEQVKNNKIDIVDLYELK